MFDIIEKNVLINYSAKIDKMDGMLDYITTISKSFRRLRVKDIICDWTGVVRFPHRHVPLFRPTR